MKKVFSKYLSVFAIVFILGSLWGSFLERNNKNSLLVCEHYCELEGGEVKQMSQDICICNGEQGQIAVDAYHEALNKK